MIDIESGGYFASDAAYLVNDGLQPTPITDPATNQPIEIIVDGNAG
jgi:hypothetical protein